MGEAFHELRLLDCSVLSDDTLFHSLLAVMDPARQEKVRTARGRQEQNLSLGAGCLLRLLMSEYGIDPMALCFRADGAPVLSEPERYLSVSHSGHYALAGLSNMPLGVDVEVWDPEQLSIANHFYTPDEQAFLGLSPAPLPDFFRLWCRKEAVIKRDGLMDLRDFSVLSPKDGCCFWDYPMDGYSCSVYGSATAKPLLQSVSADKLCTLLEDL